MHIKQITISNFRSFRQQPEVFPFSPGTNSVVGRNGSGKSNLFDAVQFVLLSPRFYTLRQEERQALLHEGSGSAAVNAFVEIVLDNADHRFSLERSDEVVLRRTVGLKKDEFFLQRKRTTKAEIQSLLEGAGFSKSNPYFMVQQGKIQDLCTMRDAERLELLQQVAGTTVYEDKKRESLLKMQENQSSIAQIQEILDTIDARLDALHGETQELEAYQQFDKTRKALEYTVYEKELKRARHFLDHVEHERATLGEDLHERHEAARETHLAIRNTEAVWNQKTNALRRNRLTTQSLEADHSTAVARRTKLEFACRELQDALTQYQEQQERDRTQLQQLQQEIEAAQDSQLQLEPKYQAAVEQQTRLTTDRDQAQRKLRGLLAKQGRGKQFATASERDAHLQSNIQELQQLLHDHESRLATQRDALSNLRRSLQEETKQVESQSTLVTEKAAALQTLSKTMDDTKKERLRLQEQRRDQWRKREVLREQVREAREDVHRALSDSRKSTPRATSLGLEALERRIVAEERLGDSYFGVLMDNFQLTDPKYQIAVEVAAQNSLFHVVVDTDDTAARLLKRLEDEKLGRVTFLPLNRLRVEETHYPRDVNEIRPMLERCIQFDPKVERAMQHVFGKKILARTPEAASEWSAKLKMDAITLEGDLCSRKGALTGGYVDVNKSRLKAHVQLKQANETLRKVESEYNHVSRQAEQVDQGTANIMHELQRLEAKHAGLSHMLTELETNVERSQARLEQHKKQAQDMETNMIPPQERQVEDLKGNIAQLQKEIGTELVSTLSEEDRSMMNQLKQVVSELTAELQTQSETVSQMSLDRQKIQSLLQDNLLKRREELSKDTKTGRRRSGSREESTEAERKADLEERQRELEDISRTADELEQRVKDARKMDEELKAEIVAARTELERLKNEDMKNTQALEEAQDQSERMLNKRSMCISKRETYMRKIQELGSLPPASELEKYADEKISDLMKSLDDVNKKLKKYSHVNKKAYDQFVNFSEQRESLLKRKEELDRGAEKVKELIESLDRQKDEAINRTFRGVSAHFRDVFKELVPNGHGEIVMKTAIDEMLEKEEEEYISEDSEGSSKKKKSFDPENPDVSLYRGIGIQVRFSAVGENYLMSQLSGGQKALVALALIFAIQRCDPAPFYLFDELDQALDSTHRAAVANLIQRQANSESPAQFIVSTFRPELVSVANQCYGISHQNKVSNIHHLSKKDALSFIANLMNEEEAVGEVSTLTTRTTLGRSSATTTTTSGSSRKRKATAEASNEGESSAGSADEAATMEEEA